MGLLERGQQASSPPIRGLRRAEWVGGGAPADIAVTHFEYFQLVSADK